MASSAKSATKEFEDIEADDALHDFGGSHGSKGHDFASYWVIARLTELEAKKQADYVFVCEYMQDVAEFDSSTAPADIRLYQLKKREGSHWTAATLTGQSGKKKIPKFDKPILKLLKHVRRVSVAKASGAFVSNASYEVDLKSGQKSVNETRIGLHELDDAHTLALRTAIADAEGLKPEDVELGVIELHTSPISINDLQRHLSGFMLELLNEVAPDQAGQASSLVETLYARIRARARRTEKCSTWQELVDKRGFTRAKFQEAVESLKHVPNRAHVRQDLFQKLSSGWKNLEKVKVQAALTQCATEKVMFGDSSRWRAQDELKALLQSAQDDELSDQDRFEAACNHLIDVRPDLRPQEVKALAIYEMTEWDLSQIHA